MSETVAHPGLERLIHAWRTKYPSDELDEHALRALARVCGDDLTAFMEDLERAGKIARQAEAAMWQARAELGQLIRAGAIVDIPETQLAATSNITRMTVRRAVRKLGSGRRPPVEGR